MIVTNIQRMCFHDGPGIRTTVFFKGCSISCPWCSNPENLSFLKEEYIDEKKRGVYGTEYTSNGLINELMKDRAFWGKQGGVTFSGGEALMQVDELKNVLIPLNEQGINTAVETSLFVPRCNLECVLPYIDYVIADVKILIPSVCKDILGGNIELYKDNLEYVHSCGKLKLLRVPCNNEFTMMKDNRNEIAKLLSRYSDVPVEIFKIHNLGEKKYKTLGKEAVKWSEVNNKTMEEFIIELKEKGISAKEIKI